MNEAVEVADESKIEILSLAPLEKARWYADFWLSRQMTTVRFGPFTQTTMDDIMVRCMQQNIPFGIFAECGAEIDWDLVSKR